MKITVNLMAGGIITLTDISKRDVEKVLRHIEQTSYNDVVRLNGGDNKTIAFPRSNLVWMMAEDD